MITVPDEVKDLFHLDHCYKNIRIHFPNGERSDICNDLIVKDSASFKESLCSQDTLKFGLCEASVFECETVGVGNIKGMPIEVFCEIECPSDVTGAEWKTDIQKFVYPVPYGLFYVGEAKRQADMNHRKITAYGGNSMLSEDNDILNYVKSFGMSANTAYQPDVFKTIMMACNSRVALQDAPLTEVGGSGSSVVLFKTDNIYYQGGTYYCVLEAICKSYGGHNSQGYDDTALYYTERTPSEKTLSQILAEISANHTYGPGFPTQWNDKMRYVKWDGVAVGSLTGSSLTNNTFIRALTDGAFVYPYQTKNSADAGFVLVPYKYRARRVRVDIFDDFTFGESQFRDPDEQKIYKVNTSNYPSFSLNYPRIQSGAKYYIKDAANISFLQMFSSVVELQGQFCRLDRTSKLMFINIKRQFGLEPGAALYPGTNVYPEGVTGGKLLPDDYQSCWYDDEYTMPFGAVRCQYKNTNNVDVIYTLYLTGYDESVDVNTYRTYDLSDNDMIKSLLWTDQQIASVCNIIASNIDGVSYMPVEFVGRGLPYVEAGDTFEILTKSSDSITTIVLDRTIKGEQTLTDEYKSV